MDFSAKVAWHANEWMMSRLGLLAAIGGRLSIVSQFTTPGDTLLTGTVGRIVKERWPRLRLNAVVHQPELLAHDPAFAEVNGVIKTWRLTFHYLEILAQKDGTRNLLQPVMARIGIRDYVYRTRIYLTAEERRSAAARLTGLSRPIVTINVASRQPTKTWLRERWIELVQRLNSTYDVVQLGDASEPPIEHATSLAGRLSLRESMAVLSHSRVHVGPVSFLMHAANGVGVPAVIVYGGRETPANSGYAENINLFTPMPCGPCWLHQENNERCGYDLDCMRRITVDDVEQAVARLVVARGGEVKDRTSKGQGACPH